jgi:hypothetical protein
MLNKIINIKKFLKLVLLLIILVIPNLAFAEQSPFYFDSLGDRNTELDKIVAMSYGFVFYISLILGIFLFFTGINRLLAYGKNPQDPKNSIGGTVVVFFAVGVLFNAHGLINVITHTISGNDGYCAIYADDLWVTNGPDDIMTPTDGECFNAETSDITKSLREHVNSNNDAAATKLMKKLNILFGILQVVGFCYFIKGIYTLKQIAEKSSQATYGQVILMLIMSSLVMDMPNTLDILRETVEKIQSVS